MKKIASKIVMITLLSLALTSCGQQTEPMENQEPIATKAGYDLTEGHFQKYVNLIEEQAGETSTIATQIALKSQLKEAFLNNPAALMNELEKLGISGTVDTTEDEQQADALPDTPLRQNRTPVNMAEGHKIVRELLGGDIGEMQFDTEAANTFRSYVANSLLTTSSNSYNSGYGSSDYSSSKGQIQFCANGTFGEVLSGHLSIDVQGASASSSGSDAMPGYWEAATLPNGMFIIIMYSTHPRMLEDSANGILPFVVAKHGPDFVQLPSGDLYRRTPNQYCN